MSDNQSVSLIKSMSKHWIIRLWTAFQAQDLTELRDWIQSRNVRNTVKLNKIFFTHSPEAEFPFNQYTVSTLVSDPELTNNR